jgi:hypothetical protein
MPTLANCLTAANTKIVDILYARWPTAASMFGGSVTKAQIQTLVGDDPGGGVFNLLLNAARGGQAPLRQYLENRGDGLEIEGLGTLSVNVLGDIEDVIKELDYCFAAAMPAAAPGAAAPGAAAAGSTLVPATASSSATAVAPEAEAAAASVMPWLLLSGVGLLVWLMWRR